MKTHAASLSRPRLSVAMIVRDEQDVLAQSIECVRGVADEIVVLDTGSIDRTPLLAAELGAAVHRQPWENDFSAARNLCLRHVSGNWVLWLDAGEQIAPDDTARLRAFLDREAKATFAYSAMIEVPPRDEGASAEQVGQCRLMPTRVGLALRRPRPRNRGRFHHRGRAWPGRGPFPHPPRRATARSRAIHRESRDAIWPWPRPKPRRRGTGRRDCSWPPGKPTAYLASKTRPAKCSARRFKIAPPGSPERLEAYYGLLTTFDDDPEMHASQLTACLDSLQEFPFDLQLLLALGNYMLVRGRLDLAIRAFDAAVRFGRLTPTVWHLQEAREIAAVCLEHGA